MRPGHCRAALCTRYCVMRESSPPRRSFRWTARSGVSLPQASARLSGRLPAGSRLPAPSARRYRVTRCAQAHRFCEDQMTNGLTVPLPAEDRRYPFRLQKDETARKGRFVKRGAKTPKPPSCPDLATRAAESCQPAFWAGQRGRQRTSVFCIPRDWLRSSRALAARSGSGLS